MEANWRQVNSIHPLNTHYWEDEFCYNHSPYGKKIFRFSSLSQKFQLNFGGKLYHYN